MSEQPRHQFGMRALLGLTAVSAVIFGAFRWLGLTPRTSLFVAAILVVALVAAISLVVAIGRSAMSQEPEGDPHEDNN
jgi:hypothetical protein